MKILMVADTEERVLWDHWNEDTARRMSDVDLILSAGDLDPAYLEFLVTMLNVPLVYVRGNHDGRYESTPPGGCEDADGRIVEVTCRDRTIRILGLGGSMRYRKDSADMYTEAEMRRRIRRIELKLAADRIKGRDGFDILLTHAPCKGYGDMDDLPHTGFQCFNGLLEKYTPALHCYGHVHKEYSGQAARGAEGRENKGFHRELTHPSGSLLINAGGYYLFELG